ncbi:MAG TPA: hypothetical protein VHZ74_15885 [Bryobacteraceae bacterium]|nr:hypothetical protein [Bryobacteraceae bacterium]
MRLDIGRAQETTSREPGAKGSGNRKKRVGILVRLNQATTAGHVEAWLADERRTTGLASSEVSAPENRTGREIARRWGLEVRQPLYRKTGDWFHELTKFPGALLDANGYLLFETEESFEACHQLRRGKDPDRNGGWVSALQGIRSFPGYIQVGDPPSKGNDRVWRHPCWALDTACRTNMLPW